MNKLNLPKFDIDRVIVFDKDVLVKCISEEELEDIKYPDLDDGKYRYGIIESIGDKCLKPLTVGRLIIYVNIEADTEGGDYCRYSRNGYLFENYTDDNILDDYDLINEDDIVALLS